MIYTRYAVGDVGWQYVVGNLPTFRVLGDAIANNAHRYRWTCTYLPYPPSRAGHLHDCASGGIIRLPHGYTGPTYEVPHSHNALAVLVEPLLANRDRLMIVDDGSREGVLPGMSCVSVANVEGQDVYMALDHRHTSEDIVAALYASASWFTYGIVSAPVYPGGWGEGPRLARPDIASIVADGAMIFRVAYDGEAYLFSIAGLEDKDTLLPSGLGTVSVPKRGFLEGSEGRSEPD